MHQPLADVDDSDEAQRAADVERLCARVGSLGQPELDRVVQLAVRTTQSASAVVMLHGSGLIPIAHSGPDTTAWVTPPCEEHLRSLHQRVLSSGMLVAVHATGSGNTVGGLSPGKDSTWAYLGVPLRRTTGLTQGVLAVLAPAPRQWSDDDRSTMQDLAALAVGALESIDLRHGVADTDRRFADMVNGLDAIIWESDVHAEYFSFINRHAETLLGYPVALWMDVADTWKRLLHPDDREWVIALCVAAVQACQDHAFDYRMIAADGRIVWIHDRVFVEHQDGVPLRLRGVMVDITATKEAELLVRESEARLAALVGHAADMVAILNADLTVRWVSPAVEPVVGTGSGDVVGTSALAWMHPDHLAETTAIFERVVEEPGRVERMTYRVRHVQGETHWVETTVTNLLDHPAVAGIVCNARDITAWVLARDEREHRERQLRAIIEASYDIISRFDRELRHVFVNQATTRFTGHASAYYLGKRLDELDWPPAVAEHVATSVSQVFASGEPLRIEFERDLPVGHLVFSCQLLPEFNLESEVETVLAISRDVTEDRRHADALQYQIFHDHLTGLPNRVMLSERIVAAGRAAATQGSVYAVLFIDLDGFKQVNDTWGHAVGDALLSEVALRLQRAVRPSDMAARLAGDEFAIVFPSIVDAGAAMRRAEQLLERMREPIDVQGIVATVTPSIGIVLGGAGDASEDLLRRADTAMYAAKRSGRNRIYMEQLDRSPA